MVWSVLGGGVLYIGWLAVFVWLDRLDSPPVEAGLWIMAPLATAAGFGLGAVVAERRAKAGRNRFFQVWPWPLVGCALGALVAYPAGPMLVAFGMLFLGTASMALRQGLYLVQGWRRRDRGPV
jgi:hypothetical protein